VEGVNLCVAGWKAAALFHGREFASTTAREEESSRLARVGSISSISTGAAATTVFLYIHSKKEKQ
jgi:hypothetical protein